MSTQDPTHRLMRWMTHLNIGAALGMVAWVAWSGWLVMTGQIGTPPQRPAMPSLGAAQSKHSTPHSAPVRLLTAEEAAAAHAHCHPPASPARVANQDSPLKEADL